MRDGKVERRRLRRSSDRNGSWLPGSGLAQCARTVRDAAAGLSGGAEALKARRSKARMRTSAGGEQLQPRKVVQPARYFASAAASMHACWSPSRPCVLASSSDGPCLLGYASHFLASVPARVCCSPLPLCVPFRGVFLLFCLLLPPPLRQPKPFFASRRTLAAASRRQARREAPAQRTHQQQA
jgi:hypothetical protein